MPTYLPSLSLQKRIRENLPDVQDRKSESSEDSFYNHIIEINSRYLVHAGELAYVGVDFDETLTETNGLGEFEANPGKPKQAIVKLVQKLIKKGITVKIFTARVAYAPKSLKAVEAWCEKYIGQVLPITNVKEAGMFCLLDDKAFNVTKEGKILHGK